MNKLVLVKGIAEVLVSVGVGAITSTATKSFTPSSAGKFVKFCSGFAGYVLGSMLMDRASKYTKDTIDATAEAISDIVTQNKTELES